MNSTEPAGNEHKFAIGSRIMRGNMRTGRAEPPKYTVMGYRRGVIDASGREIPVIDVQYRSKKTIIHCVLAEDDSLVPVD